MSLNYMHLGDAFDPSLSFVPRTGKILEAGAEFRPRPGGDVVRQLKFGSTAYVVADQKTRWESYLFTLKPLDVNFESGDTFEILIQPQGERLVDPFEVEEDIVIEPGTYEWWRYNLVGALADKRKLSGEVDWSWGGFYGGNLRTLEAKVILKPSATFTAELGAEFNRVELPEGSFDEDVYTARLQFNFSSDLQISSLLQYDNLSRSLGTNTRLRWTFHPLGDLFIVYNHNMERALQDQFQFESNQLIVKIRYALRL
jgi:hypothetical protein